MAKRFTDTDLFKKKFIRGLQGAYKLLWIYIYHDCNHAGIWEVDLEVASIRIGYPLDISEALTVFENRVIPVGKDNEKWFITSFIEFQYGELNPENRAHNSAIKILSKYEIDYKTLTIKGHTSPLQGGKDKDKDKDKDKAQPKDLKMVIDYMTEKKCLSANIEGEKFYDHFNSNGWKVGGKAPMKDWKSAVNNWLRNIKNENKEHPAGRYNAGPKDYSNEVL